MSLFRRVPLVGAYVCPRGVYTIECTGSGTDVGVERRFEVTTQVDTPTDAADQVIRALRSAGIERADVAIGLRGFGLGHHVLQLPPARDDVLTAVVEREMRRLEPQMPNPVVSWLPLPAVESGSPDAPPQRSLLAAAIPAEVGQAMQARLEPAGYRLLHLTALPSAMQRLFDEFEEGAESTAFVAPLPDGAFIGFAINHALRLIVEPPLPSDGEHESAALAEEVELGIMFVRQQYRGAHVERVSVLGSRVSLADAESVLSERLHVPTGQVGTADLSPAALAALGAVLDAQSARPLSLGGVTRRRAEARVATALERTSFAAVLALALIGGWVTIQSARTWSVGRDLRRVERQIQQDAFGLAPLRATTGQRRTVRDAVQALRVAAADRADLQQTLMGIAAATRNPVRVDSLRLHRGGPGWRGLLGGTVTGESNARAVQSLHELYRELPQRLSLDSLRLDQLQYSDATETEGGRPLVRFQLSFGVSSGIPRTP